MEEEQLRGIWRGPLHGIPIALKDNLDTAGIRTTAASELFKDRVPSEDAEVVRRLKAAGAILLGKTNLHEFAYGGSSSVSYFGPCIIPGHSIVFPAVQPLPRQPVSVMALYAPIPLSPFESRRVTAELWDSSPPMAASAIAE
jgi:hypothetical protein